MLYLALERIRKLIDNMYKINGWELPPGPPIGQDAGAAAPPPPGAGGTIPGIGTSPPIAPPEMPKAAAEIVMGMPVPQDATPAQQMDSATMHMDRMAYLSRSLKNGS
jgi:hypothetical protein